MCNTQVFNGAKLKKLVIVSTRPDSGIGGGIPAALLGYMNGFDTANVSYEIIESHVENQSVPLSWLKALWRVLWMSIKHRGNVVFWFHCGRWLSIVRKFSLALIPRLLGCETIVHIHSPTFNDYLTQTPTSRKLALFSLLPFNRLVVLSPWWKSLLIEHGITKQIVISPNPNSNLHCDVARAYYLQPRLLEKNKQSFHILTMARLIKGKGVDLVISALARLPVEYKLTIAGEGPLKKTLIKQAIALGVSERVMFTGWVSGATKDELLRQADVFCLPSSYDSFGMVFIEAMAYELPLVAYGWGPIQDVVTEDVGLCCLKPTVECVYTNILKLCSQLEKYHKTGPKKVLKYYTPEVVIQNITQLLK